MFQPIAFGSSSTGDMSAFAKLLAPQEVQVSVTVDDGFHFDDTSEFRVLHQIEPPEVLDCVDKIIAHHGFYDLILCWNQRILEACPNARLFPQSVCTWMEYGYKPWCDLNVPKQMECDASKKKFQCSFLTSNKGWAPGHKLRLEIFDRLPEKVGDLPIVKVMTPPWVPDKRAYLDEYQFTITPENASHENWYDDKIVDALMAKTIPIFWGCPNIKNYFNMDGIIHFKTIEELMSKLYLITPGYYERHYDAVLDNMGRALKGVHTWHRMDLEIAAGIERRKQGAARSFFIPERTPHTYGFRPLRKP